MEMNMKKRKKAAIFGESKKRNKGALLPCDESKKGKKAEFVLPTLPNEVILYDILTRLPVKSLLRFSCVSKLWCSKICGQESEFMSKHMIYSKRNPLAMSILHVEICQMCREDWSYYKFFSFNPRLETLSDYFCFRGIREYAPRPSGIGYCNGLFCVESNSDYGLTTRFNITNISTRELLMLPPPPPPPLPIYPITTRYGFGFDPLNREYKILQLDKGQRCIVFTLGPLSSSSWVWREIPIPAEVSQLLNYPASWRYPPPCNALYSMTALHWLLFAPVSNIISFDIRSEQFRVSPCPSPFPRIPDNMSKQHGYFLMEFQGRPCCGYQRQELENGEEAHIHLFWLLNDSFSCPKYTPKWGDLIFAFPQLDEITITRLGVTSYLGQFIFIYFDKTTHLLKFYNPHGPHSTFHKLKLPDDFSQPLSTPLFIHHVENLLSLKSLLPPGVPADQVTHLNNQDFNVSM